MSDTASAITPGSSFVPDMVCVLPEEVWPYAITVPLTPREHSLHHAGGARVHLGVIVVFVEDGVRLPRGGDGGSVRGPRGARLDDLRAVQGVEHRRRGLAVRTRLLELLRREGADANGDEDATEVGLEGSSVSLGGARAVALGRFDAGGTRARRARRRAWARSTSSMVGVVVFAIRQRGGGGVGRRDDHRASASVERSGGKACACARARFGPREEGRA